jgi:hypothetical protein
MNRLAATTSIALLIRRSFPLFAVLVLGLAALGGGC